MIGSLRGTLLHRSPTELLIEAGGVGYRVAVAPGALPHAEVGHEAFVFAHHHVREDAETLYGFATIDERELFELLLSAHGVGPSLAMAILATHPPSRLAQIVAGDELDQLCLVPGVGKKTAARLMIELKPKLGGYLSESAVVAETRPEGGGPSALADVQSALAELGYTAEEVRTVCSRLPQGADASELLRLALGMLA